MAVDVISITGLPELRRMLRGAPKALRLSVERTVQKAGREGVMIVKNKYRSYKDIGDNTLQKRRFGKVAGVDPAVPKFTGTQLFRVTGQMLRGIRARRLGRYGVSISMTGRHAHLGGIFEAGARIHFTPSELAWRYLMAMLHGRTYKGTGPRSIKPFTPPAITAVIKERPVWAPSRDVIAAKLVPDLTKSLKVEFARFPSRG